jgi:thymidylate synthase (FAD)
MSDNSSIQRQIDFLQSIITLDLQRDVLDQGSVQLIEVMGDKNAVVDAARVSFDKTSEFYSEDKNDGLLRYLIAHHHETPFEMVCFKFRINAPVVVWWHWVRHRIASYNFVSGRYVPLDEKQVYRVANGAWRLQSVSNKQGSSGEFLPPYPNGELINKEIDQLYAKSFDLYDRMLSLGIAREQARLVLPFAACYYNAIVLMNARSLLNFIRLRNAGDAQSEIRDFAAATNEIVLSTHQKLFEMGK